MKGVKYLRLKIDNYKYKKNFERCKCLLKKKDKEIEKLENDILDLKFLINDEKFYIEELENQIEENK